MKVSTEEQRQDILRRWHELAPDLNGIVCRYMNLAPGVVLPRQHFSGGGMVHCQSCWRTKARGRTKLAQRSCQDK